MKVLAKPLLWHAYSQRSTFDIYLGFYAGYFWRYVLTIFALMLQHAPVYLVPILTADVINIVTKENPDAGDARGIWWRLALGLVVILQNVASSTWRQQLVSSIDREVEYKLRSNLCARLQHLSMHFLHEHKVGMLQSKVLRDVENVEQLTTTLANSVPVLFLNVAIALTITALRAPYFLLLFLVLIPLAVLIYRCMHRKLDERNERFRLSMESTTGYVNEMLRLLPMTRVSNSENLELTKAKEHLKEIRAAGVKLDIMNAIYSASNWVLIMCFNIVTLCIAGYLKMTGAMDIEAGDIVLLTGYFNTLSNTVLSFMSLMPQISKGMESVKSLGEILECKDIEQNEGKPSVSQIQGQLDFENVSFKYEDADSRSLRDINLKIKPGETIALVGPPGAGKTTIMQLLVGFSRPTGGRICLDGTDMNELDLRTYRRQVSMISQETILFGGTIRENITYGVPYSSEEEVERVIEETELDKALAAFPAGVDTVLQENDVRLSAAMRQQIAIARSMLRNPKILLLDEPTSALDEDSEVQINRLLDKLMAGRTCVVIAHRLSTIRDANQIVVIDHGRIIENGRHEELLAKQGRYAEMWHKATEIQG